MVSNVTEVVTALLDALRSFLTPTAGGEGALLGAAGVAGIALLFAIPVVSKVCRKAIGLVKSVGK